MDASFDGDTNSVTDIPGNGFRPKRLVYNAIETIKAKLLVKLTTECSAPRHLKKPCGVPLLNMMQEHLMGEAEIAALAHMVEMPVFRPQLEVLRQPALLDKLHQASTHLL